MSIIHEELESFLGSEKGKRLLLRVIREASLDIGFPIAGALDQESVKLLNQPTVEAEKEQLFLSAGEAESFIKNTLQANCHVSLALKQLTDSGNQNSEFYKNMLNVSEALDQIERSLNPAILFKNNSPVNGTVAAMTANNRG